MRYLIRAAAIKSANDAATALGEAVAGSEEAFAARMNQYARAMGMTRTSFRNANGLTRDGHLSTARDMATLGRRLVYDFPQYYNIFSRNSTSAGIATVQNTNRRLLDAYPGADGIKTGYTRAAGFSLVSSAHRGNQRVIVAHDGRQVERLAQRRGGAADGPRLLQDAARSPGSRRRRRSAPPRVDAGASTAAARGSTVGRARRRRRPGRPAAAAGAGGRLDRGRPQQPEHHRRDRRGERRARRRAGLARPARRPRPNGRPGAASGRRRRRGAGGRRRLGLDLRGRAAGPAARRPTRSSRRCRSRARGAGTTGGNDWGVQLGAFRAKGDAERQLLTTALRDVPELSGGLRRVEAAKVQGVTIFRAQFVGLSQADALGACEALARVQAACLPLAPGI